MCWPPPFTAITFLKINRMCDIIDKFHYKMNIHKVILSPPLPTIKEVHIDLHLVVQHNTTNKRQLKTGISLSNTDHYNFGFNYQDANLLNDALRHMDMCIPIM